MIIFPKEIGDPDQLVEYLFKYAQDQRRPIARGHANSHSSWKLIPSVWRPEAIPNLLQKIRHRHDADWFEHLGLSMVSPTPKALAIEYVGSDSNDDIARLKELVIWLLAEIHILRRFCKACDRIALPVPGFSDAGETIRLSDHGLNPATPFFELGPMVAFAQHNQIPTRLLDFTDDPLKAAYFAASGEPAQNDTGFAIWLLRRKSPVNSDEDDEPASQIFRALRSQVPFLHAQDGLFLASNVLCNRFFLTHGKWPTVDRVLGGYYKFIKVICPRQIANDVLVRLDRLGISEITMKPSYQTVSETLKQADVN